MLRGLLTVIVARNECDCADVSLVVWESPSTTLENMSRYIWIRMDPCLRGWTSTEMIV